MLGTAHAGRSKLRQLKGGTGIFSLSYYVQKLSSSLPSLTLFVYLLVCLLNYEIVAFSVQPIGGEALTLYLFILALF